MSDFWEKLQNVQESTWKLSTESYLTLLLTTHSSKCFVFFSSSSSSRPVFGKVLDAFVWCNGHTQWPVGLITYVNSLWISEAVCYRNFFLYTMTAWNVTRWQENNVCPPSPQGLFPKDSGWSKRRSGPFMKWIGKRWWIPHGDILKIRTFHYNELVF